MTLTRMFSQFGRNAAFLDKDGNVLAQMNAFISPLRYKNKMYLYGVNTEIGYNSQGHYLYIGPAEPDLTQAEEGAYLTVSGEKYRIDRAEKVFNGKETFYIWAIVRVIVEAQEDQNE